MQFKLIALSAFAALAAADYQGIINALALIDQDTAKLNSTVVAYDGNFINSIPILAATSKLQDDLKNGTAVANATDPLDFNQAIGLIAPVSNIARDSNITLENLISKYPLFKKNYLTLIVKSSLQDSKKASDDFSTTLISKVPESLQAAAQNIAQPIDDSFNKAIAVFSQ